MELEIPVPENHVQNLCQMTTRIELRELKKRQGSARLTEPLSPRSRRARTGKRVGWGPGETEAVFHRTRA